MKKFLLTILIIFIGLSVYAKQMTTILSDEQIAKMNTTVDKIIKKMYAGAFLSPQDTSDLISIKIKLDDVMLQQSDVKYAPLYYKLGKIYQQRGKKQEAIECFQTIMENFSESALAPKSAACLKQMGVNVSIPVKQTDDED